LLADDSGSLTCYDWYADKVVDEWEKFGSVRSMALKLKSGSTGKAVGLVCGFDNGDLGLLKRL